ncbi:Prefoldin subunit 2 [Perkinsus chesapeaki]|uniref:Prefoldin subunit 2 n=1 Tax=Perkinsus chesapeaki TaxID=330153 RepID=A0A7J6MAQ4_PERCH|nr:Prefoldin subunit 2 [Perkinsus chesapeaki]
MASSEQPKAAAAAPSPQEVQAKIQQLDRERSAIVSKIAELEQESKEHGLVLGAFDKVPDDRRCYRLVGGVLVERTVKDFRPVVEDNKARMEEALKSLSDMLSEKTKTMEDLIKKYGAPGVPAGGNKKPLKDTEEYHFLFVTPHCMADEEQRLSLLVKKVDQLISKITSSSQQHASSGLINEVGQTCVDLTPSRDQSWRAAKRVLAVGSIENKGYLAMCLVDSIVRHETKHKSPDARCSFADLFGDHVCKLTRRALSVHATDSELGRMRKMLQGWVAKKRFDSSVCKKLKMLIPDEADLLSSARKRHKRKRRSRDLENGSSPTVSPSRAGTGTTVLHHGLMVDEFLREEDEDERPDRSASPRPDEELVTRPASPLLPPAFDPRKQQRAGSGGRSSAPSSPGGGFTRPPEAGENWTGSPPVTRGREEERDGSRHRKESWRDARHRSRSSGRRSGRSRSRDRHSSSHHRNRSRRSRSPRDGGSSSRAGSSSHGRRSFGRHADADEVELPRRHTGWDVFPRAKSSEQPVAPPPPQYPMSFPVPPAFPQFPAQQGVVAGGAMGMGQSFVEPAGRPVYPMPGGPPPPPPGFGRDVPFAPPPIPQPAHPARTKAPAFPWRPVQQTAMGVVETVGKEEDDDESSEMDIESPRVVEENKEEVRIEPVPEEEQEKVAEEADQLDSLADVSHDEEKKGGEEEEDEFNWD